ncbi:Thiol-disulfide isomerase or thioredoxin [Lutibacter oricola]|uniref:Thiol-disulfide isomerase or thioredoxin n=1 Tax=Lutibacter oricola TaxID=762486 RepID=A0A1H3DRW5_9FLAO|nr:thioredoxin family protein [Lutibacter oricola]SDX69155.1 Thiol-disulfide isomerase or thioredoxin [Lutibacter oricola]
MNKLLKDSIEKGISYNAYRKLIKDLLAEEKSTGNIQNDDMLNYSLLNDKRMDRLDKKLKISEETVLVTKNLKKNVTFLTIAEGWCGDAAQVLPMVNKIAETSTNISLKLVLRDENEALMNRFLTNGGQAIPKIIVIDEENNVIDSFGPRPSTATKMVADYKNEHGSLDAEFKKNLQLWYNKDKGANTEKDIVELLKAL